MKSVIALVFIYKVYILKIVGTILNFAAKIKFTFCGKALFLEDLNVPGKTGFPLVQMNYVI